MTKVILASFIGFFVSQALAWGPVGHSTVCQIAENHLTPQAKNAVHALLGKQSFADSCNWPDQIKKSKEYGFADTWHYVTIPNGQTYASSSKSSTGDVIEASGRMQEILMSKRSDKEKLDALRFLGHFMGDMHQPLHVGRENDRGANQCLVNFNNDKTNLHAVWDSKLLDAEGGKYWDLSQKLDRVSQKEIDEMQVGSFESWAAESMSLREGTIYPLGAGKSNEPSPFCVRVGTQMTKGAVVLGRDYYNQNIETVNTRLLQGGIRLAGVLNSIFR